MIATAMLLTDDLLTCNHCGAETWESLTTRISRTENEWECRACGALAYFRYVPDLDRD